MREKASVGQQVKALRALPGVFERAAEMEVRGENRPPHDAVSGSIDSGLSTPLITSYFVRNSL